MSLGSNEIDVNNTQLSSELVAICQNNISPIPRGGNTGHDDLMPSKSIYLAQSIICQRQLDPSNPYIWLRRLYYPNGSCVDQIIDTRNGQILQTNPAPCDPNC
jgi:hypothetical protein